MLLVSAQALASVPVAAASALPSPALPSSSEQLVQVSLALIAVLFVIYAIAWLLKRNNSLNGLVNLPMKTVAALPMGTKEKIVLIEVGGKQILLGLTAHNINTLATFDEPIIDTTLKSHKPFSSRLKEMMEKGVAANRNDKKTEAPSKKDEQQP